MVETNFNTHSLDIISSYPVIIVSVLTALFFWLLLYNTGSKRKYKWPPGPTGVPVLGYLPFLGREPFKELDRLKNIYGNIFSIRMGLTPVVILGDFKAVSNVCSKPASNGRRYGIFDFQPDGAGFTGANGEEWSEQRKFCVKSMRGYGVGRDKWESIVELEVSDIVNHISSFNGQPLDTSEILMSSVSNNISTFLFGRRLPLHHPDRTFLDKVIEEALMYYSSILAHFPIISKICVSLGTGIAAKTYGSMLLMNTFFRKEAGKMKESYQSNEHDNFIVDYLKEMDNHEGKTGHYFNEKNLFGNIQTMFLAGSDTVAVSLSWLFLAMAEYPDIQAKVQQEIDSVIDKDGRIQWTDRKKLPYTCATIMEGQRWRTTAPLSVTRMAMGDIQIQNYDIPKGTPIILNIWGLHNDRRYWKDPEKFEPKRFLTKDGSDVIVKPDSYLPFSYGKRNCPGEVVAMMELLIYFTSIMQKFTIMVPEGKRLNLDGKVAVTYQAHPQELQFIPREKRVQKLNG